MQLLANDSIFYIKKKHILKMKNEIDKLLKAKIIWEKKMFIKQVRKKSLKVLVFISSFINKPILDI